MKQLPAYYLTRYRSKRNGFFLVKNLLNNEVFVCLLFAACFFFLFVCLAIIKGAVHYKQVDKAVREQSVNYQERISILDSCGHSENPTISDFFYAGIEN